MRVLLINSNQFKQPWPVIPFGLCSIASAVENAGHQVEVLDLCFVRNTKKHIHSAITKFSPDVIGVSIRNIDNSAGYKTIFLLEAIKTKVIEHIKSYFQGPIVIGGPAVGINGPEMLDYFNLEYAIRGDGEIAVVKFLERIQKGKNVSKTPGLVIRSGGEIHEINAICHVENLNALCFPRPHFYVKIHQYRRYGSPLQIQTKRGCSQKCTYCTYNYIEGFSYRLRDPQMVADEVAYLFNKTGISFIEFTDSTFNIPLKHCKNILRAIRDKKLKLSLRTMGLNPGAIDQELIDLMKEVGFHDVDLGAESLSDITLKGLGKNFNKDQVIQAARLLRKNNIAISWYLLVGAPGESRATLHETYTNIIQHAYLWDLVNIGVGVRIYNGCPLSKEHHKKLCSNNHNNFFSPIHYTPEKITLDEVKHITKSYALSNPNFFMYDEEENTPPFVLLMGTLLLRIFSPKTPIWRLLIMFKTLQKWTGILSLKKLAYTVIHRARGNKPVRTL